MSAPETPASAPPTTREIVRRRLALLTRPERRRGAALVLLGLVGAALEWLGGASVFGFVALMGSAEEIARGPRAAALMDALGLAGPGEARVAAAVAMAAFHVARVAALLGLGRARTRIAAEIGRSLSGRLLDALLAAPYAHLARRGSAEVIRDVTEHAPVIWVAVDAVVQIALEALLLLGLFALLASARPVETLAALAVIGAFVWATVQATRRRTQAAAGRVRELDAGAMGALQHLFGGLKEVLVLGREGVFRDAYLERRARAQETGVGAAMLSATPRALVEAGFAIGAGVLAIIATRGGAGGAEALPLLGLYAYTGFRAVPGVQRIIGNLHTIHWAAGATEAIVQDLEEAERASASRPAARPSREAAAPLRFERALRLEGVGFAYPGAAGRALDDVSFEVPRGASVAIVGRTGAGKSTLLDILLGLLPPESGRVTVDGAPLEGEGLRAWRRLLGYVPQAVFLLDDTVRRNVAFGAPEGEVDDARVRDALSLAQALAFVERLPRGLDEVVGERGARLSGGERQRIAIARALYRGPEVLILDEATAALDPATERELVQALAGLAGPRTLIVVTHRLSSARRCDRVVLLEGGRVAASGTWSDLMATSAAFRSLAHDPESAEVDPGPSPRLPADASPR